ncbi:PREDICTED: mitochondrial intermembrane space import and assembly protein 40 [Nicrophorus vespilloides]|uniref:Mitochondrial intermembrane space import and assembly protein 40 n=1 Tax=Nicrophorus vespilloides TaxID=110193 RepID=A0ABM1M3V4_NICVS|nr:PREDICTED: mitochondrial intermembrane space import and assembly protein 40 [Nicrophorus vespilloides]
MSECVKRGPKDKDTIIFATKEDHSVPSKISLSEPEQQPGLIMPDGKINWNCPCLGGMATGPCGVEFRDAFSCFHYSDSDPKGSDCYNKFKDMQTCMQRYPTLYNKDLADDDDLSEAIEKSEKATAEAKAKEK